MDWNFIGFFAVMLLIIGIPVVIVFRQDRRDKERKHTERLRALELGYVQRRTSLTWPGAAVCLGIGAGVPVGSMFAAWLAVVAGGKSNDAFDAAVPIGCIGVVGGIYLARRMMGPGEGDWVAVDPTRPLAAPAGKPVADPDAYDFVGSRG